jgi:hypothetical protein
MSGREVCCIAKQLWRNVYVTLQNFELRILIFSPKTKGNVAVAQT